GNIHSRHVVEADGNVRLVEGLEARLADVQVVGPGRKVGKPVTTRLIGDGLASQVGSLVGNGDGGPRDGRTACVPDVPYDRAIEYLRFSVVWHHQRQDQGYTYRTIQHHPSPHCYRRHGGPPRGRIRTAPGGRSGIVKGRFARIGR